MATPASQRPSSSTSFIRPTADTRGAAGRPAAAVTPQAQPQSAAAPLAQSLGLPPAFFGELLNGLESPFPASSPGSGRPLNAGADSPQGTGTGATTGATAETPRPESTPSAPDLPRWKRPDPDGESDLALLATFTAPGSVPGAARDTAPGIPGDKSPSSAPARTPGLMTGPDGGTVTPPGAAAPHVTAAERAPSLLADEAAVSSPLSLSFEANVGQTDARVQFLARGPGYGVFLTPTEAVLALRRPDAPEARPALDVVRLQLVEADPAARAAGQDLLETRSNYFIGNDPSRWHTDVPNYARVVYHDVYQGVDVVYHGSDRRQLEYDFVVAPGTSPDVIQVRVAGARALRLDGQGNLVVDTAGGELVEPAPTVYQEEGGARREVAGRYVLLGEDRVGFRVGPYDPGLPLVIDPVVSYSTYLGGGGLDEGNAIAVDGSGYAYVTGSTVSANFPATAGTYDPSLSGSSDVFVTKLNRTGTGVVFSTYLGGSLGDTTAAGTGIAVSGGIAVTGVTSASNFPITIGNPAAGGLEAFVTALHPDGNRLLWSRYLGGTNDDRAYAVTIVGAIPVPSSDGPATLVFDDPMQTSVWVTGVTASSNFPTQQPLQPALMGAQDAFVTGVASGDGSLIYSSYLGGTGAEEGRGIAFSPFGIYVTGWTNSGGFPLVNPWQLTLSGAKDAFVTALESAYPDPGFRYVYSTFLGGAADDIGYGIAADAAHNAYVTGMTASTAATFPETPGAFQPNLAGGTDAFVARFNETGSGVYVSYLGGTGADQG